jgi:hypothetical protein
LLKELSLFLLQVVFAVRICYKIGFDRKIRSKKVYSCN